MKKWGLFFAIVVFFFIGCGEAASESSTREVSSEFRGFGEVGLLVEEGELKESNVVYEDAPVDFQDAVIEEMLRNMIQKPEGDVYISDLQKIHAIYWRGSYWSNLQSPDGCLPHVSGCEVGPWETKQPESLADLAYCYNLQWMEFGEIDVPSLEPLLELPQLESIGFVYSRVSKEVLEEIGQLSKIKRLELGTGEFTKWGDLTDGSFLLPIARQLEVLYACGDIDWNPQVLAQMTNLKDLDLEKATDLSFLEQMTNLEQLYMYCPDVSDWSPLAFVQNLEFLTIGGNYKVTVEIDLEDLVPLKKLDYLSLAYTTINAEHSYQEVVDALPSLTGFYVY